LAGVWLARGERKRITEFRVRRTEERGRELRRPCKGAKVEKWKGKMRRRRRVQSAGSSTEDGGEAVQRCKSAGGRCKGGKVRVQSTEYGGETGAKVQRREAEAYVQKVGAWLCRALLEGRSRRSLAPPRERSSQKRRLGWHAVPTLPETSEALGSHEVRSLPDAA
jgi:hypothetical protein